MLTVVLRTSVLLHISNIAYPTAWRRVHNLVTSVHPIYNGSFSSESVRRDVALITMLQYNQSTKSNLRRRIATTLNREVSGQSFSDQQKQTLSGFSSVNYSPTHSIAFIRWLGQQKSRYNCRHSQTGCFVRTCSGGIGWNILVSYLTLKTARKEVRIEYSI